MSYEIKQEIDRIIVEVSLPKRARASDERSFVDASTAAQILLDNNIKFGVLLEGSKVYLNNNFAHEPHRGTFIFAKPATSSKKTRTGEKIDTPKKPRRRRTNKLLGTKNVE